MAPVTFITTYTLKTTIMKNIVKNHCHILASDPSFSPEFKELPLFVFESGKNIRDHSVHANLKLKAVTPSQTLLSPIPNGNYHCDNCAPCHLSENHYFYSSNRKEIIVYKLCYHMFFYYCNIYDNLSLWSEIYR